MKDQIVNLLVLLIICTSFSAVGGEKSDSRDFVDMKVLYDFFSEDTSTTTFDIAVQIYERDGLYFLGSLGIISSQTNSGYFSNQIVDGESEVITAEDGSADYVTIGGELRKIFFDTPSVEVIYNDQMVKNILRGLGIEFEGALIAKYGHRTGGTTEYSVYSIDNDGELFDPFGGLNLGGALRVRLDNNDNENNFLNSAALGLEYLANIKELDNGTLFFTLSFRF